MIGMQRRRAVGQDPQARRLFVQPIMLIRLPIRTMSKVLVPRNTSPAVTLLAELAMGCSIICVSIDLLMTTEGGTDLFQMRINLGNSSNIAILMPITQR
jgi:hypothetical protein